MCRRFARIGHGLYEEARPEDHATVMLEQLQKYKNSMELIHEYKELQKSHSNTINSDSTIHMNRNNNINNNNYTTDHRNSVDTTCNTIEVSTDSCINRINGLYLTDQQHQLYQDLLLIVGPYLEEERKENFVTITE